MQFKHSCNPVIVLFSACLALTLLALPFIYCAENRLVVGKAYWLFSLPVAKSCWLWAVYALLCLSAIYSKRNAWLIVTFLASAALIATMLALAGDQATSLLRFASPAARVALGSSFWCTLALCLFISMEAVRNLSSHPLMRVMLNALLWVVPTLLLVSGYLAHLSLLREYATHRSAFHQALSRHLLLLGVTLIIALAISLPVGVWLARRPQRQRVVFSTLSVIQTIPSIAMFGLLLVPLAWLASNAPLVRKFGINGIGLAPALIALVLYALLPLIRSIVAGIEQVTERVRDSARGMGMSHLQLFCHVDLPQALPIWLAGLRVVVIQTLGTSVVAALIGAGGFGSIIFQGLFSSALDLVLLGVLPVVACAVIVNALFDMVVNLLEPRRG